MTWWSKLFSLCPEDICGETIFFFSKSSKLSVVFRLWGKHFGNLAKIILLKIIFIYEFIKNCFFYELFEFRYCFPTVGRKICNIGAENLEKVSKLHSTWTTELFEESLFSQDNIFFYNFFRVFMKNFADFCQKGFGPIWKTVF